MGALYGKKAVFMLLIALFLLVGIGGIFSLCEMSPLEHLSHWQEVSAVTAQQLSAIALALLMCIAVFWHVVQDATLRQQAGRYPVQRRIGGRLFDPLRLVFARGILHSKAY